MVVQWPGERSCFFVRNAEPKPSVGRRGSMHNQWHGGDRREVRMNDFVLHRNGIGIWNDWSEGDTIDH